MVAPKDRRASLSREMSLRRSFIAIHESAHQTPRPSASRHGHHRDMAITKSKSYHGNHDVNRRRTTDETHAAVAPPIRVEELPPLPFPPNNVERRQSSPSPSTPPSRREESRREERGLANTKFQRRRSTLTTAVADDLRPIIGRTEARRGGRRHSSHELTAERHQAKEHLHHHEGFCKDYALGEALRSPAHTIQRGLAAIDSLKKHDFAFVKRSDGSFSYAIVAFRSFEPASRGAWDEECMTFVVSAAGSIKTVRKRHWAESVRMVAPSSLPGMISFESRSVAADECSLISSVSDRARGLRRGRCQSA